MREEARPDGEESPKEQRAAGQPVDVRGAQGLQIGDYGRQVNYFTQVVAGKVRHAPRVTIHGQIDSPYLGLKAFGQDDAAFFFGREAAAQEILNRLTTRLDRPRPLVVSGPSGAGKSSLLQAGLLPRLGEAGLANGSDAPPRRSVIILPARAPLNELAVAAASLTGTLPANLVRSLREDPAGFALTVRAIMRQNDSGPDNPQRLLLVVDQFEQVFTQCADDAERQAFIAAISAVATTGFGQGHTPAALVVLVVRSDIEAQCAAYEELADAVQNRYLLTPMTEEQLRTVITRPAGLAQATVEPALVEELLRVGHGPSSAGVLPHLSHALDQAWRERADDDVITLADYEQVGGIEGSISASAERAFGQLTDAQQAAVQPVFMRLITTSSDLVVSAGRATRDELMAGAARDDISAILEAFAAERLLTLAEDSVEISHEALLTAWERLRSWLDGDKIDMARYSRLNTDAREWAAHQRKAAYLYPPGRLAEVDAAARRWAGIPGRYPALASGARAFLDESRKAARRTRRIRRAVIVVLTALTIAAATTAALATHYAATASQQQSIALSRALAAQVLALESSDPAGAGQLAVAAWHAAPTSQAASAMTAVLLRQGDGGIPVANGFSHSVALSPDGSLLATVSEDTSVQLWSTAAGKPVWRPMYLGDVSAVAFSPDDKVLATMDDKHVRLLTPATGRVVQTFTLSQDPGVPNPSLSSMTFSPDGKLVAAGDDGYIRLWNTATGKLIRKPWRAAFSDVFDVAFSPDGKLIASVSDTKAGDYRIELWDVATGRQVDGDLPGDTGQVSESPGNTGFSPDGKFLALATRNGVQLWRLEAGRPVLAEAIAGDDDGFAFGPADTLANVGDDGSLQLWNLVNGKKISSIRPNDPYDPSVQDIAFNVATGLLATANSDNTVQLWNTAAGLSIGSPLGPSASFVTSSSPKILLLGANSDGYVRRWPPSTSGNTEAQHVPLSRNWAASPQDAFSSTGKLLAVAIAGGLRLISGAGSGSIRFLPAAAGTGNVVSATAFSPDGSLLAAANRQGYVTLWDTATGSEVHTPLSADPAKGSAEGGVFAIAFTPDGKLLAAAGVDGHVTFWNTATGSAARPAIVADSSGGGVSGLAFSPDGKLLATADHDGTARIWDLATGKLHATLLAQGLGAENRATAVAFSPDGKLFASGYFDGTIQLWGAAAESPIGSLLYPRLSYSFSIRSLAFSPDSSLLLASDSHLNVTAWQLWQFANPYAALCDEDGPPTQVLWSSYDSGTPEPAGTCAGVTPAAELGG